MIFIAVFVVGSVIVLGAFLGGFALAMKLCSNRYAPVSNERTEEKKPIVEPKDEAKKNLYIEQAKLDNFMNYNGDIMEKPEDIAYKILHQSPKGV